MDERRRQAWAALGLGPVWSARMPAASPPRGQMVPAAATVVVAASVDADATVNVEAQVAVAVPEKVEAPATVEAPMAVDAPAAPGARPDPVRRLDALRAQVVTCPKCRLAGSRTHAVFGEGPPGAGWMIVGEAPGAQEDASGEPFVGQSGRLLDAMLAAIGLDRARDVFIANVVKCRPPGNRNPQADEIAACEPYLREQIELVRPAVLVLMGRFAAQTLLRTTEPIGALRGRVHHYGTGDGSVPALVTYHPAYLLRTPADKAKAWRDLCAARAEFVRAATARASDTARGAQPAR